MHGDMVSGRVVDSRIAQQLDIKTMEPLAWSNGDPKLQLVVTLQTALREDGEDDGLRNLYVKGAQKPGSRSLHAAVADAVRASGAKELEKGGTLTVRYEADEPNAAPGLSDRKLYGATFQRPTGSEASGTYLGTAPAQPTWQQPQQPSNGWQAPPQSAPPPWTQPPAPQVYQPPQQPPQDYQPPQQQPLVQAGAGGPSTDDIERFNAWKASQSQQG
jgi:hypothetical protein